MPINITSELKDTFNSVNKPHSDACEFALEQPNPGKQLVLMTDASFRSAGYALKIEDNPDQKIQSKPKTYAPVAFGSKFFSPAQLKMTMNSKEFKETHIAGSVNTAADFLSRLQLKVTEKIRLNVREDIHRTPIEVTTSSSDVADEEKFVFTHANDTNESEEQTLERKERSGQNAKQWFANEESPVLNISVKEFTKIDGNTTSYSMNGIKAKARIRVEQDIDLVLKDMKLKILGQPHDEVLIVTDSRYKNYKTNEDRIILKEGLLYRKFFGETSSVKYYQILIPKQLVNEVLRNLHGEFGRHPRISKTIFA